MIWGYHYFWKHPFWHFGTPKVMEVWVSWFSGFQFRSIFRWTRRSFSRVHFLFWKLFAHPIWKNNISSIWITSPIFRVKVKTSLNNCHLDGSVSIVLKPQFSPLKIKLLHSTWKFWNFIGNLRSPASCDANFGPTNMTSEILVGGFNPFEKH